ncbi:MAG: hypothetical protein OXG38_00290 [Chloroflexi bacterium]|nr:hypothetical protein [Chloroflexota bacterium]
MPLHRVLGRPRRLRVVGLGVGVAALAAVLLLAVLGPVACGGDPPPPEEPAQDAAPEEDTSPGDGEAEGEAREVATPRLAPGGDRDQDDASDEDDATAAAADDDDSDDAGTDEAEEEPTTVDASDVEAALAPPDGDKKPDDDADTKADEDAPQTGSGYAIGDPAPAGDEDGDDADAPAPPRRPVAPVVDPEDVIVGRAPSLPSDPARMGETEVILVPASAAMGDEFGWSAATDGVRIISGAPLHDQQGDDSGIAYIFVRDEAGAWVEEAALLPDDGEAGTWFGRWAVVDGDVAVVGAPSADVVGRDDDAGAAYIFQRRSGVWRQTQRLVADKPLGGDQFGWNVAIDGDTIVVSASNDIDGGGQAVYVFARDGKLWVLEAMLAPSEEGDDYFFGQDLDVSGDTIVVGAKGRAAFVGTNAGVVFVFERGPDGWAQSAILAADDAFVQDHFGRAVAIAGDTIVVGAYREDSAGADGGSVYVFQRDDDAPGGWRQDAKLIGASTDEKDWFGYEVGTDGETIVVGAPHVDSVDPEIFRAGLVTVFRRSDDGWAQVAELTASDAVAAGPGADFGWAVDVQGEVLTVGAWLADTEAGPAAGRTYAYTVVDAPSGD